MKEDRMHSGIPGFDDLVQKGIPRGISCIVAGSSGAGKTTFCTQLLYEGIKKYKEKGLFVTLETTPQKLFDFMGTFKWDLKKMEKDKDLTIITMDPFQMHKLGGSETLASLLYNKIEEHGIKRLVIDSLDVFDLLYKDPFEKRVAVHNLVTKLQETDSNLFMISAADTTAPAVNIDRLPTSVVDSIILLYNLRSGNTRQRAIEILKMRGTEHDKEMHPFKMGPTGIKIYSKEKIFR
ncbi:MAG: RAD55 family ATPase [Candidatus Hermodarchaeia archaeon]|jgi:circadian clock protein KaiC